MIKSHYKSSILSLDETKLLDSNGYVKNIVTLDAPEWVNIIPVTPSNKIVFVEQYRYGSEKVTLEIPGGMIDPGESPYEAIERELLEETGYKSRNIIRLGCLSPNPALFKNNVYSFIARDVENNSIQKNPEENINVRLIAIDEVPSLIINGVIDHALVVAAFYLYDNKDKNAQNA
tara:strand:+ start:113 stop:637 length:525 start_codon:yes stop_codon:yes gene_type:complete